MRVRATGSNAGGSESATSAPTAPVEAVAPSNSGEPTLTGTTRTGERLTADRGTWDGTGPYTWSYQWQRCDAAGDDCVDVPGARASPTTSGKATSGTPCARS